MNTLLWTTMNGILTRTWIMLVALILALLLAMVIGALEPNDAFASVRREEVDIEKK